MELVRTRAFAALLSDEVFVDVDLETVQVSLPFDRSVGVVDISIFSLVGAPSP